MAHDNEVRLLSRVVIERDIKPLLSLGAKPDWFNNTDARQVYKWMLDHYAKYNEVATIATFKAEFPVFPLLNVQDSLDYLVDKFVEYRRYTKVEDTVQEAAEVLTQTRDHEAALLLIESRIQEIHQEGVPGVSDLHLHKDPLDRFAEYEAAEAASQSGLLGLATGFEKIDEATAGLCPGQLVTVIAPPKTGKSQVILSIATNIHSNGHPVMFQSFEMNNSEQQVRHDSMRAHVDHNSMRRRILTAPEKRRYKQMLQDMASIPAPFTLVDSLHGITVSALAAKVDQVNPEVLFVDGVYLMQDEQSGDSNTPQALTNITRSLKRLAQRKNIPVVISTQTLLWKMKNGKVSADSIGYSSSFFQDSDVILGLDPVDGDDELRELRVVESRNCGPESAILTWRWSTGCFHDEDDAKTCPGCAIATRFTPTVPGLV